MDTQDGILGTNMYAYCQGDPVNLCDPSGMYGNWNVIGSDFGGSIDNNFLTAIFQFVFDNAINSGKGSLRLLSESWEDGAVAASYGYAVFEKLPEWVDGNRLWVIGMASPLYQIMAVVETEENVLDLAEFRSLSDQHFDALKAIGPALALDVASVFMPFLAPAKAYTTTAKILKGAATATGAVGTTGFTGGVIALTYQALKLESEMVVIWNRIQKNSFYAYVSPF